MTSELTSASSGVTRRRSFASACSQRCEISWYPPEIVPRSNDSVCGVNRRRMSADRCAQLIVGAMRRRKNEVVITLSGKLVLLANRVAPRLLDWVLARLAKDEGPATAGRPS